MISRAWRLRGAAIVGATAIFIGLAQSADSAAPAPKAVVADFTYLDTSGEQRDQTAEHAARLKIFSEKLRADLAEARTYDVVALTCQASCPTADSNIQELVEEARRAGADVLVFGGIHKMSTLVQWAKVVALDVQTKKPIYDRLLTFRGDTDEAWARAEIFVARELATHRQAQ